MFFAASAPAEAWALADVADGEPVGAEASDVAGAGLEEEAAGVLEHAASMTANTVKKT
jgi:hypothetical protein